MTSLASAIWQTGLKESTGTVSTASGVLKQTPFSASSGLGHPSGTNLGELIAAAHAGSFSMALSAELDKAGLAPESIRTAAGLTMQRLASGWIITQIHLDVTVKLPEAELEKFEAAVKVAKADCTISRLLKAKITVDAKLETWRSFGEVARKSGAIPLGRELVTVSLRKEYESGISSKPPL